ncbi:MAG TPA: altronate dehydratase family protein [Acidimicrobiales bacterium]|nr:altronate dehydratase family protein [Acidimicrobiales bacterium]
MTNVTEQNPGPPLMRLHPDDDCLVVIRPLRSGETVLVEGVSVQVEAGMPVGHKVASRFLAAGEPVRKCGAVIGRTKANVEVGSLLHLHNLESNYLQAHLVGDADAGLAQLAAEGRAVAASGKGTPPAVVAVMDGAEARRRAHEANQAQAVPGFVGYLRSDGRKGIRNHLLVVYLVECAHHVAREIANGFGGAENSVEVIGFPGCYPNEYAQRVLTALCTHPNVGGCLLVSLGCESFDRRALKDAVEATGRWVESLVIQQEGGTVSTVNSGRALVETGLAQIATVGRAPMTVAELVIGTICGGSDSTSLLTANPAVGRAFDRLVAAGARCIFEETGELIGCEEHLRSRATSPELGEELANRIVKASDYYEALGHASIAPGNLAGGLTTIEEKSIGAYAKSGSSTISGVIEPGELPGAGGLYLLDVVPDGAPRFGYPNINDTTEVVELIACGSHVVLFTTGRGSVVGSVISPVVKICANPETYRRMSDDMDVNAGRVLLGDASLDDVGDEIFDLVIATATGAPTRSEALGHREFQLGYKVFRSLEPSCLA